MNKNTIDSFLTLLAESPEHQNKARGFDKDADALSAYARDLGYDVSADEIRAYQDKARDLIKGRLKKAAQSDATLSPGVNAFYALMKHAEANAEVAKRLEELSGGAPDALIAYGKEQGFSFNEQDLATVGKDILEPSNELSEEELELAAGGLTLSVAALAAIATGGLVAAVAGGAGVAVGVATVAGVAMLVS